VRVTLSHSALLRPRCASVTRYVKIVRTEGDLLFRIWPTISESSTVRTRFANARSQQDYRQSCTQARLSRSWAWLVNGKLLCGARTNGRSGGFVYRPAGASWNVLVACKSTTCCRSADLPAVSGLRKSCMGAAGIRADPRDLRRSARLYPDGGRRGARRCTAGLLRAHWRSRSEPNSFRSVEVGCR
jgi:hypothetical protein